MGPPDYILGQFGETARCRDTNFFVSKITRKRLILAKRLDRFAWNFHGRRGVTTGRPHYILCQFGEKARCRDTNFFVSTITRKRLVLAKRLNRFAWNFQGTCGVTTGRPHYILGQFGEPRDAAILISLSATLGENGWTDLHEIFREGVEWPCDECRRPVYILYQFG